MHQHITDELTRRRLALGLIQPTNTNRRRKTPGGFPLSRAIALAVIVAVLGWVLFHD